MGRTARKTRSPYAAANRKSAHHSSDGETVIYRRTGSVNATTQRVPQQQPTASLSPELEQVADTVTQRIVPELKDQIAKAIEAIQRTPTLCSTPDTDLSGINLTNNSILVNDNDNIAPVKSFNDDLGVHISQQVRDKIINGEYVELENLLLISHSEQTRAVVMDNNGNLNLKPKSGKKISDINTWFDAILIYTSIYTAAHPSSTPGLLKYIYNVKLGAGRCADMGWLTYDQQFRLKRARNPSMNWGCVDMELWLLYISQGVTPTQEPQISQMNAGKCFLYNNKGRCGRSACRYLHRCLKCGGAHAALFCNLKTTQNSQNEKRKPYESFRSDFRREKSYKNNVNGFRFKSASSVPESI